MVLPPLRKAGGGRRRQLVFADPQVQISDRAMKEQIGNPLAETLDLVQQHTEIQLICLSGSAVLKCYIHIVKILQSFKVWCPWCHHMLLESLVFACDLPHIPAH